jgi:hypothetical protein
LARLLIGRMGTATDIAKLNAVADAGLNPNLAKECCCAGNQDEKRLPVQIAALRNAIRIGPTGSQTNFVQIVFLVEWPGTAGLQRRRGCRPDWTFMRALIPGCL